MHAVEQSCQNSNIQAVLACLNACIVRDWERAVSLQRAEQATGTLKMHYWKIDWKVRNLG